MARSLGSTERTSASKTRVALRAAGIGPGQHLAEGNGALGRGRVHDQNPLQLRLVAHGVQLVELLAGGDYGDAAAGVVQQHGDLLAGKRGVDGHIHGADGQRGEVGDGPLPAVFGDQGDAVAFLRAPAEKSLRQRADPLVDLVGGDGLPLAKLVLPEDGAGVGGRGNAAKQVIDGGERSVLCHFEPNARGWGVPPDY